MNSGRKTRLSEFEQLLAHFVVGHLFFDRLIARQLEAKPGLALDQVRADVGGHDDDRVAEVDLVALGIREMAFFHDLQQHVVRFRMGLLDFVKDDDRVRAAADGFGQLAGFFVADVARRRANQAADGVPFHELGHIQLDQGIFAAEHEAGQRLGQLGLADAGGAEEDEGTDRAARVFQTRRARGGRPWRWPRWPLPAR